MTLLDDLARDVSIFARWERRVDQLSAAPCWLWTGALNSDGYPNFGITPNVTLLAHRFAYAALVGPIPAGLSIDHLCCEKRCVNPEHLEAVTIGDNIRRAHARRRALAETEPMGSIPSLGRTHRVSPRCARRVLGRTVRRGVVMVEAWPLRKITVGARARRDMGDLAALADSIREVGLLHPIVVTAEGRLIAGARRLAALKRLGWDEVPVTVARSLTTTKSVLRAEQDENTCRKDFTPEEAVHLGRQIEGVVRPLAEAAERAGRPKKPAQVAQPSERPEPVGRVADVAAAGVGMGTRTYEKAKKVVEAAEADPDPVVRAVAKTAVEDMNRTGKVDGPAKRVEQARSDAILRAAGADTDLDLRRANLRHEYASALVKHRRALISFEVAGLASVLEPDDFDDLARLATETAAWFAAVNAHRSNGQRHARRNYSTFVVLGKP